MENLVLIIDDKKYQIVDRVNVLGCEYVGYTQYNLPTTQGLMLMNIDLWNGSNNNYAVVSSIYSI